MTILQNTLNRPGVGEAKIMALNFWKATLLLGKRNKKKIRQANCHTLIINESNDISSSKMSILILKRDNKMLFRIKKASFWKVVNFWKLAENEEAVSES